MKRIFHICRGGVAPPAQVFMSENKRTTTGRPYRFGICFCAVRKPLLKQNNHSTEEPAGLVAPDGKL